MTLHTNTRFVVLPLLLALGACGDGDGALATEGGDSILLSSVTAFSVESPGGSMTPSPSDAPCVCGALTYDVQLGSGFFSWDRCDVARTCSDVAGYTPVTGSRTLTVSELQTIRTAVAAVHVSTREGLCVWDKPPLSITVNAGPDSLVYAEDLYACHRLHEHFVEYEALEDLRAVLGTMATP